MGIGKQWTIQSSVFALIATILLLLMLNIQLRHYARQGAEEKAKLILQEKQATITYVAKNLWPPLFNLIKQYNVPDSYFEPSWMSATYINRTIMAYFNDSEFNTYYYKNAAINARSPENEANQYENDFLRAVRRNPELQFKSAIIEIDNKPFFIYMQPNTLKLQGACLRCHSKPENAPADLIARYGSVRSFNKKIDEIPSVLSLRIPLDKVYASINSLTRILSVFIATILAFMFFLQWFFVKKTIITPLK
ncbi:MAG: DUF3365 domain-containing protein [Spirochaetales bacterium]|jgi:hypothetical protein|nr:DUF3365 domain-containing protein [Spirochaetales bacterium]